MFEDIVIAMPLKDFEILVIAVQFFDPSPSIMSLLLWLTLQSFQTWWWPYPLSLTIFWYDYVILLWLQSSVFRDILTDVSFGFDKFEVQVLQHFSHFTSILSRYSDVFSGIDQIRFEWQWTPIDPSFWVFLVSKKGLLWPLCQSIPKPCHSFGLFC